MFKMLLGNPWTLVVLAIASFSAGAYTAHQFSKADKVAVLEKQIKTQKANYDARDAIFEAQQKRDVTLAAENADLRDKLTAKEMALIAAIHNPMIKLITREAKTDANPCPDARRNNQYLLCYNAALSGSTEDIAACEASGGHAKLSSEFVPSAFVFRESLSRGPSRF